jgi:iron complex transport system ATP-binding protein
MTDGEALIRIECLSCARNGKAILKDISLGIGEREYLSLVGPNGSGKTTLLKCLVRILKGSAGSIRVAGRRIESYTQRDLARFIAYVPQADGCVSSFTVEEFLLMARYPYLSPFASARRSDVEAVQLAMEITGTGHLADRALTDMSGGERQKVFIAAALAQETKVILLDEPTTFLDPKQETDIRFLLGRINRERGVTIVSVTHDLNAAALTGGRIVALKEGALFFSGLPREFMSREVLKSIFGTEFCFTAHPVTGDRLVVPRVAS